MGVTVRKKLISARRAGKRSASRLQETAKTNLMPQYIRAVVPGGTFFFAVKHLNRRRHLMK
jgi:hypothetical protein